MRMDMDHLSLGGEGADESHHIYPRIRTKKTNLAFFDTWSDLRISLSIQQDQSW